MLIDAPTRRGLRRLLGRRAAPPAPVTRLTPPRALPTPVTGTWVGLGQVRGLDPSGRPVLLLHDDQSTELVAEWALPYRYRPALNDLLRVARQGERAWVLGVAQGAGRSSLLFASAVRLKARTLRLTSDVAIRLRAPRLKLRVATLELLSETLHEKLGDATRQLGAWLQTAHQVRRVIDGGDWAQARRRTVLAADELIVDGEQIKVG